MKRKAALHNLGCKVNAYETEAMEQLLVEAGYEIVPFAPGADVYVINTCSVTNIADRKSRQMLHRARAMNPEAVVVAAGCYVQTAEPGSGDGRAVPGKEYDILLGNNHKHELVQVLEDYFASRENDSGYCGQLLAPVSDLRSHAEYEPLVLDRTREHTRAYLKVQDGCNQFCSYCIIPYARGRVRSRALDDVIREVRRLAGNGCREIVLTGIHLSSYGLDIGSSLTELILRVHDVEGILRIRLGSLEPRIVTEEFAAALSRLEKICPHFHLSLQSGCDSVLRRMNRHYTAQEYHDTCTMLRKVFDRPAITTDVIVGFPGETEEEFETTRAFLEEIKLYETHIFKYSARKGTRAAAMPDQVPEQIKAARSEILIALGEKNRRSFEREWSGEKIRVLAEEQMQINGRDYFAGYTREYIRCAVSSDQDLSNQIVSGVLGEPLHGHIFQLLPDQM